MFELFKNLFLHGEPGPVNTTTGDAMPFTGTVNTTGAMSTTMKQYYDTELLENARPRLVFAQLGKTQFLPANHGDSVQWRKWNVFNKALTPLVEGVIPTGQKFGQSAISVDVKQYGDYTAVSDRLKIHAVDDVILGATDEMGAAGGETVDTLVRNELVTGVGVMYADTVDSNGVPTSTPVGRYQLFPTNNRLTPDTVNKAYTFLKKQKAPFYEGNKYVAVIHPSVAYDLRSSKDWIEVHKYTNAVSQVFSGEIGELHGVRFVETTEAPIFVGADLFSSTRYLTVASTSPAATTADYGVATAKKLSVSETLTNAIGEALIGRMINFYETGETAPWTGAGTIVGVNVSGKTLFFDADDTFPANLAASDKLYPGEGGASTDPCAVYGTMFFGKDAFGVVDPEGMGMEMIIKDAAQIGGPLNQFSTIGYKFEQACKILYQNRMVRVESCSAYSTVDDEN